MDREIKFRAWDGMDDVMRYDISVTVNGNAEASWGKEKYDWILMQYTGLKDSAGKEIYEGDIVKFGTTEKHVVTYNEKRIVIRGHGDVGEELFVGFSMGSSYGSDVQPIIVGNVFENPELL